MEEVKFRKNCSVSGKTSKKITKDNQNKKSTKKKHENTREVNNQFKKIVT